MSSPTLIAGGLAALLLLLGGTKKTADGPATTPDVETPRDEGPDPVISIQVSDADGGRATPVVVDNYTPAELEHSIGSVSQMKSAPAPGMSAAATSASGAPGIVTNDGAGSTFVEAPYEERLGGPATQDPDCPTCATTKAGQRAEAMTAPAMASAEQGDARPPSGVNRYTVTRAPGRAVGAARLQRLGPKMGLVW